MPEWNSNRSRELGGFPLPVGERVRVRGFEPIERLRPPHPTPLPNGEREPIADAARVQLTSNSSMTRETNNDY
jgi:hypothetical protein